MNFVLGRELTVDLVPSEIAGFNGDPGYSAFTDSAEKAEKNLILRMLGMKMRKYQIAQGHENFPGDPVPQDEEIRAVVKRKGGISKVPPFLVVPRGVEPLLPA